MESAALDDLKRKVAELSFTSSLGRVTSLDGHSIRVSGLETEVRLGDRLKLTRQDGSCLIGEVLRIEPDAVTMLPDEPPHQVALYDRVVSIGPTCIAPCDGWIGRIVDPYGAPLDDKSIPAGNRVSIQNPPPSPVLRKPLGPRLETGFHLFNTMLPIVRGQRVGIFAGSGVGKSTLLAQLVQQLEADVVVLALVGERGREIRDFTQNALGAEGMKRTVVVAATADTAATTRLHCAQTAMRVAEYFRDQGKHVLLFVDSMTRFAEAHREAAISAGEFPSLQGFPASTPPAVTRLVERAGPGVVDSGDITAIFSVLVAKSDMDEPIADMLRGVLDGHIILDRSLAERGQFPAVDVLKSVSRALPHAASEVENKVLSVARSLLSAYEESSSLIMAGLYTDGSDTRLDQAIKFQSAYRSFASGSQSASIASSFDALALCVRRSNGGN